MWSRGASAVHPHTDGIVGLEDEKGVAGDSESGELLLSQGEAASGFLRRGNAAKTHNVLRGAIVRTLQDLFTLVAKRDMPDPCGLVCHYDKKYPLMLALKIAHRDDNHAEDEKL